MLLVNCNNVNHFALNSIICFFLHIAEKILGPLVELLDLHAATSCKENLGFCDLASLNWNKYSLVYEVFI